MSDPDHRGIGRATVVERSDHPAHVPTERARDVHFHDVPGSSEDVQAAYAAIQQANPGIFWTPHNGGHWVGIVPINNSRSGR